jgi:hypothetical protein
MTESRETAGCLKDLLAAGKLLSAFINLHPVMERKFDEKLLKCKLLAVKEQRKPEL